MPSELTEIEFPDTPFDLQPALSMLAMRGSHSHGLYIPPTDDLGTDDTDLLGVVLPPGRYYLGLHRWERAESAKGRWDVVLYEFRKFVNLLMKQNPNVLGMLWLEGDEYLMRGEAAEVLIANRALFRHRRRAFNSFLGYANAQLKKMQSGAYKGFMGEKRKSLVDRFGYDTKNAAHLIRLLHMGHEYLTTGELHVRRTWDRELLLDVKTGGWPLPRVQRYAEQWFAKCDDAFSESPLPDDMDEQAIERLVIDVLSAHLEQCHD